VGLPCTPVETSESARVLAATGPALRPSVLCVRPSVLAPLLLLLLPAERVRARASGRGCVECVLLLR